MNAAGRFVTLEGIEGVGKTTQVARLSAALSVRGIAHVVTREPGGTPLAESIRDVVLTAREEQLPPTAELLLMFAARAAHLANLIEPSLARGQVGDLRSLHRCNLCLSRRRPPVERGSDPRLGAHGARLAPSRSDLLARCAGDARVGARSGTQCRRRQRSFRERTRRILRTGQGGVPGARSGRACAHRSH